MSRYRDVYQASLDDPAPLVDIVGALPKTRSGKILRKSMRAFAHGHDEQPSTIEDPDAVRAFA